MKTKLLILLTVIAMTSGFSVMAAHKGDTTTVAVKRELPACNQLRIDIPMKVIVTIEPGAKPSIELKGPAKAVANITTDVNDETLILDNEGRFLNLRKRNEEGVTAYLKLPDLDRLIISSASKVEVHGIVTGPLFDVEVTGTGKVVVDEMNVDDFVTRVSGNGVVEVNGGKAGHVEYVVSGTGDLRAFSLQAKDVVTAVSGTAKGEVTALENLTARISGIATIRFKGQPALDQKISGTGKIESAN
jgi:hypothetical protein